MVGKKAIDYENTPITFYKFVCDNPEIVSSYVGHTVSFRQRKSEHKNRCNNENSREYNLKRYKTIRDNGGWDNWKMIEIERRICVDKRDSERYEQKLIEELQADLNMRNAYLTEEQRKELSSKWDEKRKGQKKEYYEQKKEEIKEQQRKYYEQNKDKITERQKLYREKNKEKINERERQRYLKKKNI
jgi:hypothetical protein